MAKDCGCSKGGVAIPPEANSITPPLKAPAIITKQTCPKCSYWMALEIKPSTKEKSFKCQNKSCSHVMPFSQPLPSRSEPSPL